MKAANIDPNPKPGTPEAVRVNEFERQLGERVVRLQRHMAFLPEEVQHEADMLTIETSKPGAIFGTAWPNPGPLAFETTVEDIPPEDLRKIDKTLTLGKMPITPDNRLKFYRSKLENDQQSKKRREGQNP